MGWQRESRDDEQSDRRRGKYSCVTGERANLVARTSYEDEGYWRAVGMSYGRGGEVSWQCKSQWPLEWPFHSIQLCDRLWRCALLRLRLGLRLWLNLTETGKYFEGTGSRKQAIIQMNFKSNHYKTFTKYAQHAAQNRRNLSTA